MLPQPLGLLSDGSCYHDRGTAFALEVSKAQLHLGRGGRENKLGLISPGLPMLERVLTSRVPSYSTQGMLFEAVRSLARYSRPNEMIKA